MLTERGAIRGDVAAGALVAVELKEPVGVGRIDELLAHGRDCRQQRAGVTGEALGAGTGAGGRETADSHHGRAFAMLRYTKTFVRGLMAFTIFAWRRSFSSQSIPSRFVDQPSAPVFQLDQSMTAMPHCAAKAGWRDPE